MNFVVQHERPGATRSIMVDMRLVIFWLSGQSGQEMWFDSNTTFLEEGSTQGGGK